MKERINTLIQISDWEHTVSPLIGYMDSIISDTFGNISARLDGELLTAQRKGPAEEIAYTSAWPPVPTCDGGYSLQNLGFSHGGRRFSIVMELSPDQKNILDELKTKSRYQWIFLPEGIFQGLIESVACPVLSGKYKIVFHVEKKISEEYYPLLADWTVSFTPTDGWSIASFSEFGNEYDWVTYFYTSTGWLCGSEGDCGYFTNWIKPDFIFAADSLKIEIDYDGYTYPGGYICVSVVYTDSFYNEVWTSVGAAGEYEIDITNSAHGAVAEVVCVNFEAGECDTCFCNTFIKKMSWGGFR